jgi:hypothetical protein
MSIRRRTVTEIRIDADKAAARRDLVALAAEYRGRSMPHEAQFTFDQLAREIDAYDAGVVAEEQSTSAATRASLLAQGSAFRMSRTGR